MTIPELQALAQAATPGPWARHVEDGGSAWIEVRGDPDKNPLFLTGGGIVDQELANAAFVAACDPQTVLALTEAVEAARNYLDGHDRRGDKLRDALAEIEVAA